MAVVRKPSYDPDEEYGADTWADEERTRRIDDALERQGYGSENHPGRKVDRDSIERRSH
jgi:hypothetical protein